MSYRLSGGGVEKVKEKRGTIRVEKYFQFLAISSNGEGGTKAFIHYYDDPKGMKNPRLKSLIYQSGDACCLDSWRNVFSQYPILCWI